MEERRKQLVKFYWQLDVYKLARDCRQKIFVLSKSFPQSEMYSLTDQMRKSSRSVTSHIAEAWGRRPYRADFINKLNMSESEALETQSWIESSVECQYMENTVGQDLYRLYDQIIGKLINMQANPDTWIIKR